MATEVKTKVDGRFVERVTLVKFIPDTPANRRKRDESARYSYDYAHAVLIDGVQRATWKKRILRVGWELIDIDGENIKETRVHRWTPYGGVTKSKTIICSITIGNIEQGRYEAARAVQADLIPTPAQMKKRRQLALKKANSVRRAQWKADRADAIRDQALELYAVVHNIAAGNGNLIDARIACIAAIKKVKLPDEPDLSEAPGDPPGTWLLSAGRLYEVKGKQK